MGLFIDIHAIQTLPPANLNRDENGRPKTAIYGGVPRKIGRASCRERV